MLVSVGKERKICRTLILSKAIEPCPLEHISSYLILTFTRDKDIASFLYCTVVCFIRWGERSNFQQPLHFLLCCDRPYKHLRPTIMIVRPPFKRISFSGRLPPLQDFNTPQRVFVSRYIPTPTNKKNLKLRFSG